MAIQDEDRLFVRNGLRHYRRRYSLTEVRVGGLIFVGLALIAAWVAWRGGQADPDLFSAAPGQVQRAVVVVPGEAQGALRAGPAPSAEARASPRGIAPEGLAPEGWTERQVALFGPDNVYEKINGREGYYKSFGFESLTFVALEFSADASVSVDIELYDQGKPENALGAFAGELPPEAAARAHGLGLSYRARNALYLTAGRYYVRVVGSDESKTVQAALDHLGPKLEGALPGEPLPWAYALFSGALQIPPARVSYSAESTFSFGFFDAAWIALLEDAETELFVSRRTDPGAAHKLAAELERGFLEYGEAAKGKGGLEWAKDRYLGRFSAVIARGNMVLGVRGAKSIEAGTAQLQRLEGAAAKAPAQ